ncbi:TIGR02569 family protein [Saccharomonospora sp. NB11]|uniref:TIGR02569 family protein n=1 Tax=Saccharomonospora sp. NB11 TaxID=1642298 RepID=UPI0018D1C634|nr:TIGR02569 family protein [Saccharomonospora sp. NB11]
MIQGPPPPEHTRRAFGLGGADVEPLVGGQGWRCGDVVLEPVHDRARGVWLSRVLATLDVPELRIARPVGATDGRWVVGGWRARRLLTGAPEHRPDETVLAAVHLHRATATFERPAFLDDRQDVFAVAERMAWDEERRELDEAKGGRLFEILAPSRRPVRGTDQLVHAELFGTLLFEDGQPPGLVGFVPHFRPAEWGAAVAAVDAVAWGGADGTLLRHWSHLPEWSQLLLRAVLFRLAWHALHPRSSAATLDGLRRVAGEVTELL